MLLERMGKTLFFRSGGQPLILTEEQREERKLGSNYDTLRVSRDLLLARLDQLKHTSAAGYFFETTIPALSHRSGGVAAEDDDDGS